MTDTDWADEIARQLDNDSTCNNDVAAALRQAYQNGERRGRAMGMREAADHCNNPDYAPTADRYDLAHYFENEADKLDPPNPKGEAE